jgi:ATP-dependent Lhr-like helicase
VEGLREDILASLNGTEMAKRQFREIARVAGLVQQGYPGAPKSSKQVQASSGLLFDVFSKYDPSHLLLRQADEEVLQKSLEQSRLHSCLQRLSASRPLITHPPHPTPMAFPILVDRLRETVGEESVEDRIRRLAGELEEAAG